MKMKPYNCYRIGYGHEGFDYYIDIVFISSSETFFNYIVIEDNSNSASYNRPGEARCWSKINDSRVKELPNNEAAIRFARLILL